MSHQKPTNPRSAEDQPLRSEPETTLRVYRLPQLGAIRPAGSLRGAPPWESPMPEQPVRPARDYYFA